MTAQAAHPALEKARAAHAQGDLDRAIKLYQQVIAAQPRFAEAHFFLAIALRSMGRLAATAEAAKKAVALAPRQGNFRGLLATALVGAGRADEAIAVWRDAIALNPEHPAPRVMLASMLAVLQQVPQAIAVLEEAAAAFPNDPQVIAPLAKLHEISGHAEESRRRVDQTLAISPKNPDACMTLARLERRAGNTAQQCKLLEELAATAPDPQSRGLAMVDLAVAADRAGDYQRAFAMASQGKAQIASSLSFPERNPGPQLALMGQIKAMVTPESVQSWEATAPQPSPSGEKPPIFVVGFPRTGTTLLEQMLSAHPGLCATDEIPLLQMVRDVLHENFLQHTPYPKWLDRLSRKQVERARAMYLERAAWHMGDALKGKRLVDKQPMNLPDLCLIKRLFPESPVIVVLRDPRDTCLSCYFQPMKNVPAFYDFRATTELYAAFMDLWRHFRAVLGLKWVELRYEDLVADPEAKARELISFIGEPWDDRVLAFHDPAHRRYVATPSYQDVAKPIYRTAKGRWRNYPDQMASVDAILRPSIEAFGYS